jgi:prepilin-type N-terminal cleavage/methylation domain-containing protein
MVKGFSLLELLVVVCIAGLLAGLWLPRAHRLMDWLQTERAVREVTTAIAVGRHGAVMQATRARVRISSDSLRVDRMGRDGWERWWGRAGPTNFGVQLEISNPELIFGPTGMGWGVSNTKIVLRRGSQVETITMSRLGRVRHW